MASFIVIFQHLPRATGKDNANLTVVGVLAAVRKRTPPENKSESLRLDPISTFHRHGDICSMELPCSTFHVQVLGLHC